MMTKKKAEKFLFFVCLLFLPTQLGKHFFLNFSHIYSLPVDYLAPTIYFWDLLLIGLVLVWLTQRPIINKQALNLFLFFLLTQMVSLVGGINFGAGLFRLEQYFLTGLFGVYIGSQKFENIKNKIIFALVYGSLFEGLLAIFQFLFKKTLGFWIFGERTFSIATPSIAKFDFFGQAFLRPYGTFPHPNLLAAFLLISIILIYYFKGNKKNLFINLSLLLSSLTIFLSFSRGVILIFIIWLFLVFRKKIKLLWPLLILAPFLIVRFLATFNFDYLSILRREELNVLALQDFLASPLKGVGLNSFINQTSISSLVSGASRFLQPVHNIFLLTLAETGILGFLGLVILITKPLINLSRKRLLLESKVLMGCFGVIIFLGTLDHYFLTLPQGLRLFFLIWGLSLAKMR